jgi:hypothetical protein
LRGKWKREKCDDGDSSEMTESQKRRLARMQGPVWQLDPRLEPHDVCSSNVKSVFVIDFLVVFIVVADIRHATARFGHYDDYARTVDALAEHVQLLPEFQFGERHCSRELRMNTQSNR